MTQDTLRNKYTPALKPEPQFAASVGSDRPGYEISIFDEDNPASIINVLDPWMKEKFLKCVDEKLLGLDESDLREMIRPTPTLNKLRVAFWYEYDLCVRGNRKLSAWRVYTGICTKDYWHKEVMRGNRIAWILCPVSSYATSMEEALEFSVSQIRKMLQAPLFKKDGYLDVGTANVMLKVHKLLDDRVNGAIAQKIEAKSLVVKKDISDTDEDVDARIKELENKLRQKSQNYIEVKDDPKEEDYIVED